MLIVILYLLFFTSNSIAQQPYVTKTLYESLETLSPTLYKYMDSLSDTELFDLLSQTNYNTTFFLPTASVLNASIVSGKLNFSLPTTVNSLLFLMLNGSHSTQSLLSSGRQFYTTLLPTSTKISIGPLLTTYYQVTNDVQLFSGISKANITATEIQCSNGMIQWIDNFLQPAETPLSTISIMPETEYMEGLLKSLNVSDTINGINKTILAPINEAWELANGSNIPFGTLVHDLKYLVMDGIYTSDQLLGPVDLPSDYKNLNLHFQLTDTQQLMINNKATIVETDILTTNGIIHLIDRVLNAAEGDEENKSKNGSVTTTDSSSASFDRPSVALHLCIFIIISFFLL